MYILGITGTTGAGKTTLLKEIEKLGGYIIDCDEVYHELLEKDTTLQESLYEEFGDIRSADNGIDRKKLGSIVFNNPGKLKRLNKIVQGVISERVRYLISNSNSSICAIDAPLLLDSDLLDLCNTTIAVLAPIEIRINRIMKRDNISRDYAESRIKSQKSDEYFRQHCNHILWNDSINRYSFKKQVIALLKEMGIG